MTHTRLTVQSPEDFQPGTFNPDNCGSSYKATFYADLNGDSTCEKIVVRESTYTDVPVAVDQSALVNFIRHSIVTIEVYDVSSLKTWLLSPKRTVACFDDNFEMSLHEFYTNVNGACPPPTFRGLFLDDNGSQRYLDFCAGAFTLTSYHSDNGVQMTHKNS